jgi:hypothetical protein
MCSRKVLTTNHIQYARQDSEEAFKKVINESINSIVMAGTALGWFQKWWFCNAIFRCRTAFLSRFGRNRTFNSNQLRLAHSHTGIFIPISTVLSPFFSSGDCYGTLPFNLL